MSVGVRTRRFSVAEYHRMAQAGILKEDDRVEIVEAGAVFRIKARSGQGLRMGQTYGPDFPSADETRSG